MISQVWFQLLNNEQASRIVQRSADVWHYSIFSIYTYVIETPFVCTAWRRKYKRYTSRLHAGTVSPALNLTASIFTIAHLAALLVTVLGDSAADCHKEQ
jgi:hypothetical protein